SFAPEEAGEVGYDIILVGKPTDRSGFGGAAFASASMEEEKREQNSGAVQEPNPFLERHLLASCYALFDWLVAEGKLDKISCKDLGAGGVVCASVEQMTEHGFGAEVNLDAVHTAIDDLPAEVIACAETQERLCFTCHPDLTERILKHFNETWDLPSVATHARASLIGKVTTDGIYTLTHKGEVVCKATAEALTCGLLYERPTTITHNSQPDPEIVCTGSELRITNHKLQTSIEEVCTSMIAHPNHASKSPAFLHFDKNIIGNTIIEAGEADAAVFAPLQDLQSYVLDGTHPGWELSEEDKWRGVAVAGDGNGRYGRIDAYWQGVNAAVEAMRNVVAVGATPRALTDCLNYGNPEIPEQLAELSEGVRGIADAGKGITFDGQPVPVISGNVSLYNGKPDGSSIDPTAIVSCAGVLPDARKAVTMQLKENNSVLVLIGKRKHELGGSAYYQILDDALVGSSVPKPDVAQETIMMNEVLNAIRNGHVLSCHDISNGGLLLAAFEMTLPCRRLGGQIGIELDVESLGSDLPTDTLLFSESGGFLLEVSAQNAGHITSNIREQGIEAHIIGKTSEHAMLKVVRDQEQILNLDLQYLHRIWELGLKSAIDNIQS
ncbi:MAG: phosphoribosylformylglycinamidine synthase, partial [Candidatus Peregrinibacteria bacterium]|nr:phosphoribosylformylglycinamidine synthase [Candidatus Peregrinibacteria bacterium]